MAELQVHQESKPWHTYPIEKACDELATNSHGLSPQEAAGRLLKFGPNELAGEKKESPLKLLANQFLSLLMVILIIAAAISFQTGDVLEAISIIVIVILAGVLGFFQEYQAGKAIESLKKMASPRAHVIRDGEEVEINAADVVPGDIIVLKTGDKIPADGKLIEANNLQIEESSLTGESVASFKDIRTIDEVNVPLGDKKNIVFMGTSISYGRGKAVVFSTGMHTEFGKIASMLQNTENRKTPLQENLDHLGKKLGIFAIGLASLMSVFGVLRDAGNIAKMFTWGVALAVAIIPEALPAVVTISLALGIRRMVKRKALIRKLPAVETLGATNIICTDKTGTLTQDEMTIRYIFSGGKMYHVTGNGYVPKGEFFLKEQKINPADHLEVSELLRCGALCGDTKLKLFGNDKWDIVGDPTEGALVVAATKAGMDLEVLLTQNPRIDEIPFSSETKRMTTVHQTQSSKEVYSKGAVEVLLSSSDFIIENGERREITNTDIESIMSAAMEMSGNALRVLAVAKRTYNPQREALADVEHGMTFLGIIGMFDPPREEVKAAIQRCFEAGIKPIMITGDHKITAIAVAKELGIMRKGNALSGAELELMSDEQFENAIHNTVVFARISPAHKLKIVQAFMDEGHIVAMTGDGVNDAPALKKADIGVAMGITGTDVSKEAADMILTDDNFASIVNAIEEGRSIFENIRKYLVFLLSGNMGTVFALVFTLMSDMPIPLNAAQILFINFIMDGLMAIALGVEPPEPGIMKHKPRNVKEGILNRDTLVYIGFIGGIIAFITCGVYVWAIFRKFSDVEAKTMFFYTLIFARLFNGFNCRSLEQSVLHINFFGNRTLILSTVVTLILSLGIMASGDLQTAFAIKPISMIAWSGIIGASLIVLIIVEFWKMLIRANAH